ncbi:legumain-like isoform X2 [Cimex lectularius]|uniref:legumain n=1 Tax=Cimex lectularius TaxID=79782 RepID=A0A8I6RQQ1_CIMLE|nr:legumain-like isoform X2 [Cimex lectularius]
MWGGKLLFLFSVIVSLASVQGAPSPAPQNEVWAFLVAGSSGYYNYRHQADVCHAYHIMLDKGVPPERVVVMMVDDVANDPNNPQKGTLFNKPGGPNVYKGCKVDYKGTDVNVPTFLNVLKGNKTAVAGVGTGRVIESTNTSHVFVNFVDHGGVGLLCFPDDDLYADILEKALRSLAKEKRFAKLVLYVEACESGSVFDNILEENMNIYVSTAAARDESSWGWYCDNGTCLGDQFSISWMEHMDTLSKGMFETLFHQYRVVRTAVTKSHVNLYGDFRLGYDVVEVEDSSTFLNSVNNTAVGVNSRDVALHFAKMNALNAPDHKTRQHFEMKLTNMKNGRDMADKIISLIMAAATKGDKKLQEQLETTRYPLNIDIFPCYRQIIAKFKEVCFNTNKHTYFLQHLYKFANLCVSGVDIEPVFTEMAAICNSQNYSFGEKYIL